MKECEHKLQKELKLRPTMRQIINNEKPPKVFVCKDCGKLI